MAIIWNKIIPRWGGDTIEPPEAKKDVGYIAGDKPPAKWENWLRKGTYEALDETRDVIESIDSQLAQKPNYEEGVWTPEIKFGGSSQGISYAAAEGRYKRIGNRVFASIVIGLSNKGTSVGNVSITGLPFVKTGIIEMFAIAGTSGITMPSSGLTFYGLISAATNIIQLRANTQDVAINLTNSNFVNTSTINFIFQYDC